MSRKFDADKVRSMIATDFTKADLPDIRRMADDEQAAGQDQEHEEAMSEEEAKLKAVPYFVAVRGYDGVYTLVQQKGMRSQKDKRASFALCADFLAEIVEEAEIMGITVGDFIALATAQELARRHGYGGEE